MLPEPALHVFGLCAARCKSLQEAAACGLPIVTTDVPGCREVVRAEQNGILIPHRDATALAKALNRLIADAPLRAKMGEKSREIAEREFSIQNVVAHTLETYRLLLAAQP